MPVPYLRNLILTTLLILPTRFATAETFSLESASIKEINEAIDAGSLSSEKLVGLYLKRIEAYDQAGPSINAVIHLNENALAEAKALDEERLATGRRSPLHGIPVLVKDNYDTFDMPTTGGSIGFKGAIPAYDAFMVKKLREAGAILIAKTNMDEMARGGNGVSSLGGQTLNPHRLDLIPGGSSAGSGAGLAANFAPLGLGTETGGSVRHPANDNNVVGMVATEGLLSRAGIMPISISQDRGGPMTRTVYDCAVMLSAMVGIDPNDQITRNSIGKIPNVPFESYLVPGSLNGKRIGVLRDLFATGPEHDEYNQLIEDAITTIDEAGAVVVDPVSTGRELLSMSWSHSLGNIEYKAALNAYLAARGPGQPYYSLQEIIESGKHHPRLNERYVDSQAMPDLEDNPEYAARYRNRAVLKNLLEGLIELYDLDALVYPVRSGPLPAAGTWPMARGVSGQSISDYCGLPAITVPAGFTKDGTPNGIEFLGASFEDAKLLQVAYGYEQAAPHLKLPETTPALPGETFEY